MDRVTALLTGLAALPYGLVLWASRFSGHPVVFLGVAVAILAVLFGGLLAYLAKPGERGHPQER
jgi:hypothetical protein